MERSSVIFRGVPSSVKGGPEDRFHIRSSEVKAEISAAVAFRRLARYWLERVARQRLKAAHGDTAALHRMRVGIVHLRTACSFFSPMVADAQWDRLRHEFKWLNAYLGAARDLDVVMIRLLTAKDRSPDTVIVDQEWRRRCTDNHQRLARALLSSRYLRLISDTSRWIDNGVWMRSEAKQLTQSAALYFSKKLTRWHKALRKKAGKFAKLGARERHQLRFRSKKLRYAIEFFGDVFPRKHRSRRLAMLQCLGKAQQSLGELNDSVRAQVLENQVLENQVLGDNVNQGSGRAAGRSHARVQISLRPKQKKRLKRAGSEAFRKIAELKPCWD
jgi:CHAD domain-containing protein